MKALDSWEARLTPYFNSGLRLIGEIPLYFSDMENMAAAVRECIRKYGMAQATQVLTAQYPLTLITLMSTFAAYNTHLNYWQAFSDLLETNKTDIYTQRWHRQFVHLAESHGLKVFGFADDPTPYVMSIRFQGGIPAYSLPDYFEKMVLPAVERPSLRNVQPKEALEHLLAKVTMVDSPVLDFLKNSGDLGVDFFAESCKLARYVIEHHGAMPPEGTVNLPEYVLSAFADTLEHPEDGLQHWRKPYLQAAPYSEDSVVNLILPRQEITTLDLSASRLYWQVLFPGQAPIKRDCRLSRSQQNVVTEEHYLPVPSTVEYIEVSLNTVSVDAENPVELRCWNLPLLPPADKIPLVAFNQAGQQIITMRQLQPGVFFLLMPLNSQPVFEGPAYLMETCLPLVGAWKAWKMERWDLTQAWSIRLVSNGQPQGRAIPVLGSIAQPDLVDGYLFKYQDLEELLYISGLPSVRVPMSPGATPQARLSELSEWQVRVCSVAEANPRIDTTVKLSQYPKKVKFDKDRAIFPLENILGARAAGIYDIRIWGPRGLRADFRMRLWPKLMIYRHSMNLTQPEEPPKPAVFTLLLPPEATCQPQTGHESVQVERLIKNKQLTNTWKVTVPLELNRVPLELTMPGQDGGAVHVLVSIPLPRPRWGLASSKDGSALEWGQKLLHYSIDQLLQSGSTSLHVEMYGLGSLNPDLKVCLTEISDSKPLVQEAKLTHTGFTPDWLRVSLGQFSATLQHIKSKARFDLVRPKRDYFDSEVRIPLLEVNRALDYQQIALAQVSETTWKLTWQEQYTLKNRRVMIRPIWQPWQKPWEFKIPDNAQGEFLIEDIALPRSRYYLYFYILPDYAPELSAPPDELKPDVWDLCTPQQRVKAIPRDEKLPYNHFRNMVELAIIQNMLGNNLEMDLMLSEAGKSLTQLTDLNQLIDTLKWIQNSDIAPEIKGFIMSQTFNVQVIKKIFTTYHQEDPALREYLGYIAKIKNVPTETDKYLLAHVNDPGTIATCLRSLIAKKDTEIIDIVINMISEARLSQKDAIDLLSIDLSWALKRIAAREDTLSDSLLVDLLPQTVSQASFVIDPCTPELVTRAISYDADPSLVRIYLDYLFKEDVSQRFEILMNVFRDAKIESKDIKRYLSQNPFFSLKALEAAPDCNEHCEWIEYVTSNFQEFIGIITRGDRLHTPAGIVKIDYIEQEDGTRVNSIRLTETGIRIHAYTEIWSEQMGLMFDFESKTVSIDGATQAWRCGNCGFLYTLEINVIMHSKRAHRGLVAVDQVHLPVKLRLGEIIRI